MGRIPHNTYMSHPHSKGAYTGYAPLGWGRGGGHLGILTIASLVELLGQESPLFWLEGSDHEPPQKDNFL